MTEPETPQVETPDRAFERLMEARQAEWDAVDALHREREALSVTPVVDDDFPTVLDGYERAVQKFLGAYNRRAEAVRKCHEARAHAAQKKG